MRVECIHGLLHEGAVEALLLSYWAVFVGKEERLQVDDFLAKLRDLAQQMVILRAVGLYLLLEISQPLLLTLATLECSDP